MRIDTNSQQESYLDGPTRLPTQWSRPALPACEMCYAAAVPACEMCFAEVRLTPWVSAAHTSYH